jgi:hypothetical protein
MSLRLLNDGAASSTASEFFRDCAADGPFSYDMLRGAKARKLLS